MKNKWIKATGIILAISLLAAGCGQSGTANSKQGESEANKEAAEEESVKGSEEKDGGKKESATLTVEASQEIVNNIPYAFSEENIAAFEKEYPEIKVELVLNPDAQNTSILQTKLASGQPSDLICYNKVSAENELEVVNV